MRGVHLYAPKNVMNLWNIFSYVTLVSNWDMLIIVLHTLLRHDK